MLRGMTILVILLMVGETVSRLLPFPIPGNVLGLVFMVLGLTTGLIQLEQVEKAADLLLNNLTIFFAPAGISIILYLSLVRSQWLPLTVGALVSTVIVLVVTGKLVDLLQGRGEHHGS